MKRPPRYYSSTHPNLVCKLDKALYGLKQAPRAWYSRLSTKFAWLGFLASQADTSLFIYHRGQVHIFLLIYVNDIIIVNSSNQAINALLNDLRADFALKYLGQLSYFLGIDAQQCHDGIELTQDRYTRDILHRVGMQDCKSMRTPLPANEKTLPHRWYSPIFG
jgi:hypothetical protein